MKKKIWCALLLMLCIILSGFTWKWGRRVWMNFNQRVDTLITLNKEDSITGKIGSNPISLENDVIIQLETLNTENDIPISFTFPEYIQMSFDGIQLDAGVEILYRFHKISESNYVMIHITNTLNGSEKDYWICTYPDFMPRYTSIGKSPIEGDYYLSTYEPNALLKINRNGEIVFYKYDAGKEFGDFKKVNTPVGNRYIYTERYETHHSMKGVYHTPSEIIILDDSYRELNRLKMYPSEKVPFEDFPVDNHDVLYFDDNHYILISYMGKTVYNVSTEVVNGSSRVVACIIQEIKNGQVVFEWDSSDYPELYEISENQDFGNIETAINDYAHLNSIAVDNDNNIICSFRNLSTILKIDRKTGNIIWRLGGKHDDFGLEEYQLPSCQHYARRNQDGSISIFDNGNKNMQSRVVKFWIDEENKKLLDWNELAAGPYFGLGTGSAQKISDKEDVFVVGWGLRTNDLNPSMSEINFSTGETYFELFFGENIDTYRCVKY